MVSRTLPLNSSNSWSVNSTKHYLQANQEHNKAKQVIRCRTGTNSSQSSQKNSNNMNCISSQNFSTTNDIRHVSHMAKKASIQKKSKERHIILVSQSGMTENKKDHERKKAKRKFYLIEPRQYF